VRQGEDKLEVVTELGTRTSWREEWGESQRNRARTTWRRVYRAHGWDKLEVLQRLWDKLEGAVAHAVGAVKDKLEGRRAPSGACATSAQRHG
jgi:hypothetical protein